MTGAQGPPYINASSGGDWAVMRPAGEPLPSPIDIEGLGATAGAAAVPMLGAPVVHPTPEEPEPGAHERTLVWASPHDDPTALLRGYRGVQLLVVPPADVVAVAHAAKQRAGVHDPPVAAVVAVGVTCHGRLDAETRHRLARLSDCGVGVVVWCPAVSRLSKVLKDGRTQVSLLRQDCYDHLARHVALTADDALRAALQLVAAPRPFPLATRLPPRDPRVVCLGVSGASRCGKGTAGGGAKGAVRRGDRRARELRALRRVRPAALGLHALAHVRRRGLGDALWDAPPPLPLRGGVLLLWWWRARGTQA